MNMDDTSLREALRAESESFRKLEEMHSSLDKKLVALSESSDHSLENEMEEKRLKKLKLKVKDEMYQTMRQFAEEQKSAS
ncbi:MAG TPA: DUF465 domain-containing protein [bacterium]|nr:DUF465 domain-containing protein [bacterium]